MRRVPIGRAKQAISNNTAAAQRFVDATHEYDGATMNVHTGHLYEYGENVHMVGGHTGQTGSKIPTHYYDRGSDSPHLTAAQAHQERLRVLASTGFGRGRGGRDVGVGSWIDRETPEGTRKGVQMDATSIFHDRRQAEGATLHRNEDAMFNMSDLSETRNEDIRAARGLGPRPPKTD